MLDSIQTANARTELNRNNALLSTGPVTPEGKARAAQNARTHGMTARAIVLPDESLEDYNALVEPTIQDLKPQSEHERSLAINVANCIWRRERNYRTEAAAYTMRARQLRILHPEHVQTDEEARAFMLLDPDEAKYVRLLLRYVAAAERAVEKAVREYHMTISRRQQSAEETSSRPPRRRRSSAIPETEEELIYQIALNEREDEIMEEKIQQWQARMAKIAVLPADDLSCT